MLTRNKMRQSGQAIEGQQKDTAEQSDKIWITKIPVTVFLP